MDTTVFNLKAEVEKIILGTGGDRVTALEAEVRALRGALEAIAEPSHFVLPAEAHALKSIASAALRGDVWR